MSVDIAAENAVASTVLPADWQIAGAGSLTNVGFARRISYNVGQTAQFSCHGTGTVIDIYRVGYYQDKTMRKIATITNTATAQPASQTIPNSQGATTCTNWSVTATWAIPAGATSGLYVAVYRGGGGASYITFVVRDDAAEADIIYKTSDATWGSAYNQFGTIASPLDGKNVYGEGVGVGDINSRCLAGDYHRPVITRQQVSQTYWMACELPMIRFLERNGLKVKYVTSVDLDTTPALLLKGKVFLSSGHDEYWSLNMRRNVEGWRDQHAGRSVFFSANEVFWKTEYVYDGDRATMWCKKDTMPGPSGSGHTAGVAFVEGEWQGTWKDQRWEENEPEWLLTGTDFRMNGVNDYDAIVPKNPYGGLKVWGQTSLVDSQITLTRVIGFEADSMRPTQPGQSCVVLAAYTRNIDGKYADNNGQDYAGNGNLQWGIIAQRYVGGGLTVGFGTCQWSWSLDAVHDRGTGTEVSLAAQQFTLNMLTDLGAAPYTRMSTLAAHTPSSLDEYGIDPSMVPGEGGGPETDAQIEVWHAGAWVPAEIVG